MAAKHTQNYKIGVNIQQVKNVIRSKIFLEKMRLELCGENVTPSSVVYEFHCKMTFTSYGEHITAILTPIDVSTTAITIFSKCCVPTQIVDWGKNKQNVANFFSNLVDHINHLPPQPVKQPVEQHIQPSAQPTTPCFCQHCGAPIGAQAVFCNQCGNRIK